MKKFTSPILVVLLILVFLPVALSAADSAAAPAPAESGNWLLTIIPIIVPGIIALIKWAIPSVPKAFLPILAPILGAAIDLLGHFAGLAGTGTGMTGAILGAAGVAVREAYDQTRKALSAVQEEGRH